MPSSEAEQVGSAEAARILGVSRQAAGKAIRAGRLPASRRAGRYELAETDVRMFAAARQGRRSPAAPDGRTVRPQGGPDLRYLPAGR
jgi:Helix-turn-helix domain